MGHKPGTMHRYAIANTNCQLYKSFDCRALTLGKTYQDPEKVALRTKGIFLRAAPLKRPDTKPLEDKLLIKLNMRENSVRSKKARYYMEQNIMDT